MNRLSRRALTMLTALCLLASACATPAAPTPQPPTPAPPPAAPASPVPATAVPAAATAAAQPTATTAQAQPTNTTAPAPAATKPAAAAVTGVKGAAGAFASGPGGSAPTSGTYVADLGFRPEANGFKFENYGKSSNTNLTASELQRLFGDQVCASLANGQCVLTPSGKQWMESANAAMDGGHCEGFAALSLLMFAGKQNAADFGGPKAADLALDGNVKLQREIALWFITQGTSPASKGEVKDARPVEILDKLTEAFKAGASGETYTMGIYKPGPSAGHTITPYAVEDRGNGVFWVMVYDNNFPGQQRAVEVDRNADTWTYVASTNPSEPASEYKGDATTKTLTITPSSPRLQKQACPFCDAAQPAGGGAAAALKPLVLPLSTFSGWEMAGEKEGPTSYTVAYRSPQGAEKGNIVIIVGVFPDAAGAQKAGAGTVERLTGEGFAFQQSTEVGDATWRGTRTKGDATAVETLAAVGKFLLFTEAVAPNAEAQSAADFVLKAAGAQAEKLKAAADLNVGAFAAKSMAPPAQAGPQYNQIWIDGDGDLLITDGQGRRYGYANGQFVKEIPNVESVKIKSVNTWEEDADPVYYVPVGMQYTLTIDGSRLKAASETEVAMIGPGYDLSVSGINLEPGQKDTLVMSPDGSKLTYTTKSDESPTIDAGFESSGADFAFTVKGVAMKGGGSIVVGLDRAKGQLSIGTKGTTAAGTYALAMERIDDETDQTFSHDNLTLDPGDSAVLSYGDWKGEKSSLSLGIDKGSKGTIDQTIELSEE